jgi:hypothetical protein
VANNAWIGTRVGGQLMFCPVWLIALGGFFVEAFVA